MKLAIGSIDICLESPQRNVILSASEESVYFSSAQILLYGFRNRRRRRMRT